MKRTKVYIQICPFVLLVALLAGASYIKGQAGGREGPLCPTPQPTRTPIPQKRSSPHLPALTLCHPRRQLWRLQ